MGLHEWMMGKWDLAKRNLARSGPEGAGFLGAMAYAEGDAEQAERLWNREEFSLWRGYALVLSGDLDEARALFEARVSRSRDRDNLRELASALDGLRLASEDKQPTPEHVSVYQRLGIPIIEDLPEGPEVLLLAEPRSPRSESRRRLLTRAESPHLDSAHALR
jgi:hypothetical protein